MSAADFSGFVNEKASQGVNPITLPQFGVLAPEQKQAAQVTYAKTKQTQAASPNAPGPGAAPPITPSAGPGARAPSSFTPPPQGVQAPPSGAAQPPTAQSPASYTPPSEQVEKPPAAPAMQSATLQKTSYHQPNKALMYLAAGLTLLFPNRPIGYAAASFMRGLGQGAQQRFERDTEQAKEKYASDEAAAATKNEQAKLGYAADTEAYRTRVAFAHEKYTKAIASGINPVTGQPMLPDLSTLLPRNPKTGQRDQTYAGYAQAYGALSQLAARIGATDVQTSANQMLAKFSADAQRERDSEQRWRQFSLGMFERMRHDDATSARFATSQENMESRFERSLSAREGTAATNELLRVVTADSQNAKTRGEQLMGQYHADVAKAFPYYQKDPSGVMVATPHTGERGFLRMGERLIATSGDPQAAADWMGSVLPYPNNLTPLLQTYAQAQEQLQHSSNALRDAFDPRHPVSSRPFVPPFTLPDDAMTKLSKIGPKTAMSVITDIFKAKSVAAYTKKLQTLNIPDKDAILDALGVRAPQSSSETNLVPAM